MKVLGSIFINFPTNIPYAEYYAILVALFFLQPPLTLSKENDSKHNSRNRTLHILASNVLSSSYCIFSDCISEYNPLILALFCQSMLRGLLVILTKDFPNIRIHLFLHVEFGIELSNFLESNQYFPIIKNTIYK